MSLVNRRGGFGTYSNPSNYSTPSSSHTEVTAVDIGEFVPSKLEHDEAKFKSEATAILERFKDAKGTTLTLPAMNKRQRFLFHNWAHDIELRTFSTGKDPNRFITLCHSEGFRYLASGHCDQFAIRMSKENESLIKDYLKAYPIENSQVEHHYEQPVSKKADRGGKSVSFEKMLIPRHPSNNLNDNIARFRRELPAYQMRDQILKEVDKHRVILITGGTGCGKTTQVPQFLLEEAAKKGQELRIICTQPRRLPAIAVAERVAKERGEYVGSTVGYHIRLEQKTSAETVLTYCTSGVLLRMLTVDSVAKNVSHIILDEVHEREQNTDYLLIALKQALMQRTDLKVILMSATMEGNREMFLNYFKGSDIGAIDIPARLYNVEKFFLEDILAMTGYLGSLANNSLFSVDSWGNGYGSVASNISSAPEHQLHPSASTPAFPVPPVTDDPIHALATQLGNATSNFTRQNSANVVYNEATTLPIIWSYDSGPSYSQSVAETDALFGSERLKYQSFDEKFAKKVRGTNFHRDRVVSAYLSRGMRSWSDNIDTDLVAYMVNYLMMSERNGAILVFLPGYDDILQVRTKIIERTMDSAVQPEIFTLHSQMNSADQQKVFQKLSDKRKVILSTNIAEASLTIDDVVYVIDCGKVKEKIYDHHSRISQLRVVGIAQSNAEQRSGRAGRCTNGYCFRLYSQQEYDEMSKTQVAEMKRAAIHDVCLHAKMFAPNGMSVKQFLGMAPEPPDKGAIDNSFMFLQQIGALFNFSGASPFDAEVGPPTYFPRDLNAVEPDLTELGSLIAHLPLDPQLARMLLYSIAFKCFNPVVTLVAALSHRDPFILPLGDEKHAALVSRDEFGRVDYSDHLTLIRACYKYFAASNKSQMCKSSYLGTASMRMIEGIRKQLTWELKRLNLIPDTFKSFDDPVLNEYSDSWPMVQAAIVAGCYPGIGVAKCQSRIKKIRTQTESNAILHPGSVLKRQIQGAYRIVSLQKYGEHPEPLIDFMAFQELSQIEEGPTLRTVTATTPIHVLLFAGSSRMEKVVMRDFEICSEEFDNVESETEPGTINFRRDYSVEIDNFLAFRGEYETMKLLMKLRFKILNYFMMWLRTPSNPAIPQTHALLKCLNQLLNAEHKKCQYVHVDDLPSKKEEPVRRQFNNRNDSSNHLSSRNGSSNYSAAVPHQPLGQNKTQNRKPDMVRYAPPRRSAQQERKPDESSQLEENSVFVQREEDEADPLPSDSPPARPKDACKQATVDLLGMVQQMQARPSSAANSPSRLQQSRAAPPVNIVSQDVRVSAAKPTTTTTISTNINNNAATRVVVPNSNPKMSWTKPYSNDVRNMQRPQNGRNDDYNGDAARTRNANAPIYNSSYTQGLDDNGFSSSFRNGRRNDDNGRNFNGQMGRGNREENGRSRPADGRGSYFNNGPSRGYKRPDPMQRTDYQGLETFDGENGHGNFNESGPNRGDLGNNLNGHGTNSNNQPGHARRPVRTFTNSNNRANKC